ncbi:MAG: Rdx family protein [Candidatus Poribacteria bacterium]|nr:Rdx family protein [Candidatus Poribacteria bacterium]MDP6747594.1 Rdx family protein [Candidatus Poribacteria bacterium]MDP6998953.1 Rdx family protein [Candidatus Poribacteria bacterium]MDP7279476.1 Rdx family protein [Candidatus Poribacteria bacterium]
MPRAVSLADSLLGQYKTQISSLTLVPSGGGCFEVSRNDKLLYSKLKTREFPNLTQITDAIDGP